MTRSLRVQLFTPLEVKLIAIYLLYDPQFYCTESASKTGPFE